MRFNFESTDLSLAKLVSVSLGGCIFNSDFFHKSAGSVFGAPSDAAGSPYNTVFKGNGGGGGGGGGGGSGGGGGGGGR